MKTRKPLAVGDRVRVYHGQYSRKCKVSAVSQSGTLVQFEGDSFDNWFHINQCVRLKKRAVKVEAGGERERIVRYTVGNKTGGLTNKRTSWLKHEAEGWLSEDLPVLYRLIECAPNEKPISREALSGAWKEAFGAGNVFKDAMPRLAQFLSLPGGAE